MTVLQMLGFTVLAAVTALLLRTAKSPLAPFITLSCGILLLLTLLPRVTEAFSFLTTLTEALPEAVGQAVGKTIATGVLCSLGADTCTELGAPALGEKLLFAGKIEILLFSLPLMRELFARVEELLS